MRERRACILFTVLIVSLVPAACGGMGRAHASRMATVGSYGSFPAETIVGTYSVSGCATDTRTLVRDGRAYYAHSTGKAPAPADLYYFQLRLAYAHFEADGCTSAELGRVMERGLTARQRTFLLNNVASDLYRAFRAALDAT